MSIGTMEAVADRLLTAEQFAELPEEPRAELVKGRFVEMPRVKPLHGLINAEIIFLLKLWAREAGFVVFDDSGIITTRDPDSVRGPDCFVYRRDDVPADLTAYPETPPSLCVEIRSPSSTLAELQDKADEYLAIGVAVVWLVMPETESVEVVTADGRSTFDSRETLPGQDALPGLAVDVASIFAFVTPSSANSASDA